MNHNSTFVDDLMVRCASVVTELESDSNLASYIDASLPVPRPYLGAGEIRLIVLGQDPTVENANTRKRITTVLMLNKAKSNLRRFIQVIGERLGLSIDENVYATNVCKNFFMNSPTAVSELDLISASWKYWQDVLQDELKRFPEAVIVSLGNPVLNVLVKDGFPQDLKHYWGHVDSWNGNGRGGFSSVEQEQSTVGRQFFPLPHVTNSNTTEFYRTNLDCYVEFIRSSIG